MCLRCAKAAYSSPISIQLQLEGSAELPLIGRTAREELVCVTTEPRVHKVLGAGKRQQYARKHYYYYYCNSLGNYGVIEKLK